MFCGRISEFMRKLFVSGILFFLLTSLVSAETIQATSLATQIKAGVYDFFAKALGLQGGEFFYSLILGITIILLAFKFETLAQYIKIFLWILGGYLILTAFGIIVI